MQWSGLGLVAGAALVAAVIVVSLFSLGVVALGNATDAQQRGGSATTNQVLAYVCFAICAAVVAFGIVLIAVPSLVPKVGS